MKSTTGIFTWWINIQRRWSTFSWSWQRQSVLCFLFSCFSDESVKWGTICSSSDVFFWRGEKSGAWTGRPVECVTGRHKHTLSKSCHIIQYTGPWAFPQTLAQHRTNTEKSTMTHTHTHLQYISIHVRSVDSVCSMSCWGNISEAVWLLGKEICSYISLSNISSSYSTCESDHIVVRIRLYLGIVSWSWPCENTVTEVQRKLKFEALNNHLYGHTVKAEASQSYIFCWWLIAWQIIMSIVMISLFLIIYRFIYI